MSSVEADLLLSRQFAHDLRSPMAALLVLVTGLRQQVELEGRAPDPEMLAMMEEALLAMDAMLMGLVAIGGGAGPGAALAPPGPFSFSDTLGRVAMLLAPWNRIRGTRLTWTVEGEDQWVGHPDLLAHLLFLFLVALLHAAPPSDAEFRLSVLPSDHRDPEAPGVLIRIEALGALPNPDVLAHLQGVVDGTAARTLACQAHLPLEGALWLTQALGARLAPLSAAAPSGTFLFFLPARPHNPAV